VIQKISSFLKSTLIDNQVQIPEEFQNELFKIHPNFNILNQLKEKFKIDLNFQNSIGETLLHISARKNNQEAIEYLLKHKVNISIKNHKNLTPLHIAVMEHNKLATLAILNSGIDIDEKCDFGRTLFQELMIFATKPIAEGLIVKTKNISNIDDYGRNVLFDAVVNGSLEIAEMLLRIDAIDKNIKDKNSDTILHLKSCITNPSIAMLLIKNGVDPTIRDKSGKPYLLYAIENQNNAADIFSLAKSKHFDINVTDSNKNNAIHHAIICMKDYIETNIQKAHNFAHIILQMVKLSVDVNSKNEQSLSPLNLAGKIGNYIAFCMLIKINYVNMEICDSKKRNIWHNLAINLKSPDSIFCLDTLVAKSYAMLRDVDVYGMTPVEYAILNKNYQFASRLYQIQKVEICGHPKKNLIFLEVSDFDDVEQILNEALQIPELFEIVNMMRNQYKLII
jgi:ankyrin repeat protein